MERTNIMKFLSVFPDFTKTAQDGGEVVSLTHRPPLFAGVLTADSLRAESCSQAVSKPV